MEAFIELLGHDLKYCLDGQSVSGLSKWWE